MDSSVISSYFLRLSSLLEAMPDALVIVDENGQIVLMNRQTEILFGYERNNLMGKFVEELMPERFRARHPAYRDIYFSNPRVRPMGTGLELYGLKQDGIEFPIEISLSPLNTEEGQFALAAIRDISQRKKTEAKFKAILEATPDCLVIINNEGQIILVNALAEKLFGHARNELIGKRIELLIPGRYKDKHTEHRLNYFKQPRVRPMGAGLELYGLHKDGHEFPVEISLSPLETEEGILALAAVRDITDRKRIEDAKAMLSAIVEFSDDAIVGKNLDGTVFSWNQGAERLYGYKAEEVVGRKINFLIPPNRPMELELVRPQIERGESARFPETLRLHKKGILIPVSITISPIKNAQGKVIGASTTARDITAQKKLEAELRAKNIELEAANLSKDHFFATMSHELRTPLNAIIGFTGTLLMKLPGELNDNQEKQLNMVQKSAKHLLSLINDLLDLTKIEAGKQPITVEEVNCNELLLEIETTLKPSAAAKNIDFKLILPNKIINIFTDKRSLTQIVLNLVNNAIKFTDKGMVSLELCQKIIENKDFALIIVTDTGIGIRSEDAIKLFKAFQQIPTPGVTREGTGLGLHVSKKLGDLIHAKIEFNKAHKHGSQFSVLIPFSLEET